MKKKEKRHGSNRNFGLAAALTSLEGSEWGAETGGKPEQYIQFKESGVARHGGRNRFGGRYAFDGDPLKIGSLVSTRLACTVG